MRFIDLFAGLGGFHLALQRLGHTCVFASELDDGLADLYERNFGLRPAGDIRRVSVENIPAHDILCAGFPCQPFSKAGEQKGFDHPEWGDLFDHVLRILRAHRPGYFILENVPNLTRHAGGDTWRTIKSDLMSIGYEVLDRRLSPHQFGIPQIRERIFIVGSLSPLTSFSWPQQYPHAESSIVHALKVEPADARKLTPQLTKCLEVWQDFLDRFPRSEDLPSFPIWSMEFGASYPYERATPYSLGMQAMEEYLGSHGRPLIELPLPERHKGLPSHALREETRFPDWKIRFIKQNRTLYQRHKAWIDPWIPKIRVFPPSLQKLEWNCKDCERDIWRYVLQVRASGVRVKRPTTAPSLVAMTTTQVPIIAWERRYMTPRECAALQSLDDLPYLPAKPTKAFKALGNAVNATLVEKIAIALTCSDNGVVDESAASGSNSLWSLASS